MFLTTPLKHDGFAPIDSVLVLLYRVRLVHNDYSVNMLVFGLLTKILPLSSKLLSVTLFESFFQSPNRLYRS